MNEEQFFLSLMAILSATVLGFTLMCIGEPGYGIGVWLTALAVSYTHLTLPTI